MKNYLKPHVRVINLDTEGVIAGSKDALDVNLTDPEQDQQLSNKKHGIWDTDNWLE